MFGNAFSQICCTYRQDPLHPVTSDCESNRVLFRTTSRLRTAMLGPNQTPRVLKILWTIHYRMSSTHSTSLIYPDRIFSSVPPPPRHWPPKPILPSSQTLTVPIALQWQESKDDKIQTFRKLYPLQQTLRSVHKRKVSWPTDESNLSEYV